MATAALRLPPWLPHPRPTRPLFSSRFLSPITSPQTLHQSPPRLRFATSRTPRRPSVVVASAQSNMLKVIQTAWKIGKDGIEAGTNLVPDTVPKPIARIGVTGVAVTLALFLLQSFISTAFFVLAMMGVIYLAYISLNKDEGPRGGNSSSSSSPSTEEETLEEARRIMDKYK